MTAHCDRHPKADPTCPACKSLNAEYAQLKIGATR